MDYEAHSPVVLWFSLLLLGTPERRPASEAKQVRRGTFPAIYLITYIQQQKDER